MIREPASADEHTRLMRECYKRRLAGQDDFQIAEALKITVARASSYATEWTESNAEPDNVEARRTEVARVDTWLARVDAEYCEKNITVDKAVTAFCRLSERRCKLLGLEAPTRAEVAATLTSQVPLTIEDEIRALSAELGLNDRKNA